MEKAAKMKEESKLMSVVMDWLKCGETNVITPAFVIVVARRQDVPSGIS